MKTIKQNILLLAALSMLLASGCEKTYDEPAPFVPAQMTPTMTISQFKALYKGTPTVITDPGIVISGRVISNDKFGNFYRSFFIQDASAGIEVKVGRTTLYNTYKVGQVIYVKPASLCLGKYGDMINLGYSSTDPKYETAYIDAAMIINQTIFKGEMGSTPLDTAAINTSAAITSNIGKLVTLKGVTYKSGSYRLNNVTYAPLYTWAVKDDPNTTVDDSAYGEQIFTLSDGREITVRTSGYAKFATTRLPDFVLNNTSKIDITGVLTNFNTTIQLVLNTDSDVKPAQ